jgi:hypothetical protein
MKTSAMSSAVTLTEGLRPVCAGQHTAREKFIAWPGERIARERMACDWSRCSRAVIRAS